MSAPWRDQSGTEARTSFSCRPHPNATMPFAGHYCKSQSCRCGAATGSNHMSSQWQQPLTGSNKDDTPNTWQRGVKQYCMSRQHALVPEDAGHISRRPWAGALVQGRCQRARRMEVWVERAVASARRQRWTADAIITSTSQYVDTVRRPVRQVMWRTGQQRQAIQCLRNSQTTNRKATIMIRKTRIGAE